MDLGELDSLTFYQDCIDFDMKSDYERVLSSTNFNYEENSLSFSEDTVMSMMDPLNNTDLWLNSESTHNLDLMEGDLESAIMVNPNSVIPLSAETVDKKIKDDNIVEKAQSPLRDVLPSITIKNELKQEETSMAEPHRVNFMIKYPELITEHVNIKSEPLPLLEPKVEEMKPVPKAIRLSDLLNQTSSVGHKKTELMTVRVTMPSAVPTIKTTMTSRTVPISFVNNSITGHYKIVRPKQPIKPIQSRININKDNAYIGIYPRPTYSYSCLIAMALKNSSTGSLPVSEIYNFMW